MFWKFLRVGFFAFLFGVGIGYAKADAPSPSTLRDAITSELQKAYPTARIEIDPAIEWTRGTPPSEIRATRLINEGPGGQARIWVQGASSDAVAEGRITFTAKVPAYLAIRRVFPGDKLDASNFKRTDIDVTRGQAHELRGVILPQTAELGGLEARQTILEGQFVVSTSVQRQPDVRRGDVVRIRLISGDLTVSLQGVVQEPAYLSGQVRVLSDRTKRELVGELQADRVVEVNL